MELDRLGRYRLPVSNVSSTQTNFTQENSTNIVSSTLLIHSFIIVCLLFQNTLNTHNLKYSTVGILLKVKHDI